MGVIFLSFLFFRYSPEFALRSYSYVSLFSSFLSNSIPFMKFFLTWLFLIAPGYQDWFDFDILDEKMVQFHLMRIFLGLISSLFECWFCEKVSKRYGKMTGYLTFIFFLVGAGFSHSTVSLMPTSTNQILTLIVFSLWMEAKTAKETKTKVLDIIQMFEKDFGEFNVSVEDMKSALSHFLERAVGVSLIEIKYTDQLKELVDFESLVKDLDAKISHYYTIAYGLIALACFCWPYIALNFLFVGFELLNHFGLVKFSVLSAINLLLFVVLPSLIDARFYGAQEYPVVNQIMYNVGNDDSSLYGVESSSFYFKNLFVNFNVLFPLALCSMFLILCLFSLATNKERMVDSNFELLERVIFRANEMNKRLVIETLQYNATLLLVLLFFSSLPHKEERFLTQSYPLIALLAAVSLTCLSELAKKFKSSIANVLKVVGVSSLFLAVALNVSRNMALQYDFQAPFTIFGNLNYQIQQNIEVKFMKTEVTVCMGKDWYMFPSSFFLPLAKSNSGKIQSKMLWYDSEYSGLLPQPFGAYPEGVQKPAGTFNDRNRKEASSVVNKTECMLIIEVDANDDGLQDLTSDGLFEIVLCARQLNLEKSKPIFRSFYDVLGLFPDKYHYSDMCLLHRKDFKIVV